jgi:predicted DNA-binding transcriptional regulator AlpA
MAKQIVREPEAQARKKKKVSDRLSLGGPLLDEQVLTIREFAALNGVGLRTAIRIIEAADGPATVRLSARRIGVTVKSVREWQARRARPPGEDER